MWAPVDSSQAETASLNSWSIEQQSRWGGVGDQSSSLNTMEEHMRSIVPPAFRNNTAKVIWQETKSLEANINEALGIWQTTPNQLMLEQELLNGVNQYPPSFAGGGTTSWSQPEIEQRTWDMQTQTLRTAAPFCGLNQSKLWPSEEQVWGGAQRPPAFHTGPPPPTYAAGWQQTAPRGNVFPPPTRFSGPPFENNAVMGNWVQRPINEPVQPPVPSGIPPPQRSRLQNVWGGTPAINNTVNGMYLPPPNVEYNIPNGMTQWSPPTGNTAAAATTAAVPAVPKPQFNQNFVNRSPPPNCFSSYSQTSKSDSFMGENAVWQDPEGEIRKWQRDTGTAAWGDPEKQPKETKRWIIPAGKEYENTEGGGARTIVPMGWGDLPPKSSIVNISWPNKTQTATVATVSKSGTLKPASITTLWDMISEHQQSSPLENNWMQPDGTNSGMPHSTQQIVDQIRQAVTKGFIDVSLLSKPLPNEALSEMRVLLSRIPVLEQAENELARLMSSVKISNDGDGGSGRITTPTDLMTPEQRTEYSRLVIEIAATKTEIASIRERISGTSDMVNSRSTTVGLGEAQRMQPQAAAVTTSSPRFGDSILDVAVRVEQQKLFSI